MRSRADVRKSFITLGVAVLAFSLCGSARASPLETQREVPGWPGRAYDLVLPSSYGERPEVALIVAIHGGGGNKRAQRRLSCPDGNLKDRGACI